MDARIISKQAAKKIETPDYWLTSPAIRAYSTAVIFANAFKFDPEKMVIKQKIYEATIKSLKQIIASIPDNYKQAILFGHNPGLTNYFNEISDSYADNIPTCGALHLISPANKWKEFGNTKLQNDFYLYPKEL
jgi:phosphohistidine phosphatase